MVVMGEISTKNDLISRKGLADMKRGKVRRRMRRRRTTIKSKL